MSTSRWLTWTPNTPIIEKVPEPEPTKPPKTISEGFEGAPSALFTIIEYSPAGMNAASAQIFRWIRSRCVRRREIWGSEKSLWRDYLVWCPQDKRSVVQREQFAEILDESFRREMDGWLGIALAIDVVTNPHIM